MAHDHPHEHQHAGEPGAHDHHHPAAMPHKTAGHGDQHQEATAPAHGHGHEHGPTHSHEHSDGRHHSPGHQHAPAHFGVAFAIGIGLNIALVALKLIVGYRVGSFALIADAGHVFGDVLGLALSWWAMALQRRAPTDRHTYGLRRSSVLVALTNAVVLLGGMGALAWEAVGRFQQPVMVDGIALIWVSAVGIVINGVSAALFMSGAAKDLNLRSAFLHLAADAAVSVGVVIAGVVILATGWQWIDPLVSLAIVAVIVWGTWSLFAESLNLALDAAPAGVDVAAIRSYLRALPGVSDLHDLHVWAMSTTETALTAHLVIPAAGSHDDLLHRTAAELQQRFGIGHATIQIESGEPASACRLAADGAV
jgi:cobalt-zinc-cadmium efflux system protein